MRKCAVTLLVCVGTLAGTMFAAEGPVPKGVPHLDHVFVILMENHAYCQFVGNPNAPFANRYMKSANTATNYYAIVHAQVAQRPRDRGRFELRRSQR